MKGQSGYRQRRKKKKRGPVPQRVDSLFWRCWLVSRAVSACRICALDICYCQTVSRAAQRAVPAPAFGPRLASLECDVCVLPASLATAVVSVTVGEFELVAVLCA